jgi:multimeric flavodoxin WrbA
MTGAALFWSHPAPLCSPPQPTARPFQTDRHAMKHLLVIYSSQSGRTADMVAAAIDGAAALADEVEVRALPGGDAGIDDLLWAEGLVIGSPENFGYMAGVIKDFFDRTYYPAQGRTNGLPYALVISAGNDGSGAVRAIERIALGYGWQKVSEPVIARGELDESALAACRELGQGLAAGLACGVF